MKHVPTTPLPFKSRRVQNEYLLLDGDENTVGHLLFASEHLRQTREAQAVYIAHACNAYPDLITRAKLVIGKWNAGGYKPNVCPLMGSLETLLRSLGEMK
jgi:hypothetical protein